MARPRKRAESASVSDTPVETNGHYDRDRIAQRAYELYLQRGGGDGGDFDDWIEAERELTGGHVRSEDRGE